MDPQDRALVTRKGLNDGPPLAVSRERTGAGADHAAEGSRAHDRPVGTRSGLLAMRMEERMHMKVYRRMTCAGLAAVAIVCAGAAASAAPLLTQGIGTSNCTRLAADLKPGEGLGNPVNLMAYSWAQGYISAANISLAEAGSRHVDLSQLDEAKVLTMLVKFCKANPDKQPLAALNDYLRRSPKVRIEWEKGSVDWNVAGQ